MVQLLKAHSHDFIRCRGMCVRAGSSGCFRLLLLLLQRQYSCNFSHLIAPPIDEIVSNGTHLFSIPILMALLNLVALEY